MYPWIIYEHDNLINKAFCSECTTAVKNNVVLPQTTIVDKNTKNAFVVNGFNSWGKALERFKVHEGKIFKILIHF